MPEGGNVVLSCQYLKDNKNNITFFKNGEEIGTLSSKGVTEMTIESVTQADEGFYKCVAKDTKMESPESWLSVAPDQGLLSDPNLMIIMIIIFSMSESGSLQDVTYVF